MEETSPLAVVNHKYGMSNIRKYIELVESIHKFEPKKPDAKKDEVKPAADVPRKVFGKRKVVPKLPYEPRLPKHRFPGQID